MNVSDETRQHEIEHVLTDFLDMSMLIANRVVDFHERDETRGYPVEKDDI
jgi:hypothetical protein